MKKIGIMKPLLILIILFQFTFLGNCQDFIRVVDNENNIVKLSFIDQRTPIRIPIIIEKIIPGDKTKQPTYNLGFYIIVNLFPIDFFMYSGGRLVFEDSTSVMLEDPIFNGFLSGGKHQIAIRHQLSNLELAELQQKSMDYFVIGNVTRGIDKYERDFIKVLFQKIEVAK
jgi:hypothetical protein